MKTYTINDTVIVLDKICAISKIYKSGDRYLDFSTAYLKDNVNDGRSVIYFFTVYLDNDKKGLDFCFSSYDEAEKVRFDLIKALENNNNCNCRSNILRG